MKSHSKYLWFNTKTRQELINITDMIQEEINESGIKEDFVWLMLCILLQAYL